MHDDKITPGPSSTPLSNQPVQPAQPTPSATPHPAEPAEQLPKTHVAKLPPVIKPSDGAGPHNPTIAKTAEQLAVAQAAEELAQEEDVEETEGGGARDAIAGVIKTIFSWVVMPILIVFFLHSFVFQAFYVSGSSMNPDFQDGDYLIIDKFNFTLSSIKGMIGMNTNLDLKRGDVLVFRYPNSPSTFFIKRLIGLPGDRVVVKGGKVMIYDAEHPNGLTLKEPYIDPAETTQGDIDEVVEQGKYFVMGDNRSPNGSFDSREWGQLPRYDIVGVASARLLPINELGPIKHPSY